MAANPAANKLAAKSSGPKKASEKKSAIPDDAPRPQDHLPAKADVVKDETPVEFEWLDETYTMVEGAFDMAQDIDFLEQLQDGNLIGPFRSLLGVEQWEKLKAAIREDQGKATMQEMRGPFEASMKALRAKNS